MTETPGRFRKRPVEIEARRLLGSDDGQPAREIAAWCGGWLGSTFREPKLVIPTLEGDMVARPGDWVVRGVKGEFYPVRADIFAETYEPASSAGPAPATDRAARRERYAAAISETDGWVLDDGKHMIDAVMAVADAEQAALHARIAELESSCRDADRLRRDWVEMRDRAEALDVRVQALTTAVLPASTGRADVLREAADGFDAHAEKLLHGIDDKPAFVFAARQHQAAVWREAAETLRRMADETPQPTTEAHPPSHRWYVETLDGLANEWAPGMRFTDRTEAVERYQAVSEHHPLWKDGTPVQRRFVRETTSYTVEPAPAAVAQPDEEAKPRQSCACGQDGCEYCNEEGDAL